MSFSHLFLLNCFSVYGRGGERVEGNIVGTVNNFKYYYILFAYFLCEVCAISSVMLLCTSFAFIKSLKTQQLISVIWKKDAFSKLELYVWVNHSFIAILIINII